MTQPAKILVTGFGPFPGAPHNPSADLVRAIAAGRVRLPVGVAVVTAVLPTSWERVLAQLPELWTEHRPDVAVHFGLHLRSRRFRIEQTARNRAKSLPDVDGRHPPDARVMHDGPAVLRSPVHAEKIAASLRALGLPATLSRDAGGYLCNMAFYLSLIGSGGNRRTRNALFVHIPPAGSLDGRDDLLTGAQAILRACAGHARPRQGAVAT